VTRAQDSDLLSDCIAALDAGQIVVLPTRRWYMLCADSTNGDACRRIFDAKGRSDGKPLALVMPSDTAVAAQFSMSPAARCLAEGLWPGDLALKLPWRAPRPAPDRWWLGSETALVTRDPWLLGEVAAQTRNPPATTVVSVSNGMTEDERQPALSPEEVRRFIERTAVHIAVTVDHGVCPIGRGLTVVDCATSEIPQLLRDGAVHPHALREVLRANRFSLGCATSLS
jgi:L-threonylcarbamoyladenylate synthase